MLNETIGPNAGMQFPTENTDMPFYMLVIDYNGYFMVFCHGTEGTHSVKIDGIEETILKIDKKYLPPLVGKEGPGKGDVIFNDYVHNKISAGGSYNFVEGYANRITCAGAAHVEGYQNIADHSYTHVEGRGGLATSEYSHVEGDGYF
jgi:hypothetical protein